MDKLENRPVTTDSRDCPEGSVFFALKGDNFNGNQYAQSALDKGCAYAVIDEPQYAVPGDDRYIIVPDVLKALQEHARDHRRRLGTPIIGITGTNGKTTTKELIAAVLSKKFNVLYTQGNFNNHIGVPKTLLRLTPEHDIAVVEMGANHPGEIETLVNIAEPNYGLITNVGKAHLEGFGSFEGVKKTKGELYDYLRAHGGKVFLDTDNPHLVGMWGNHPSLPYLHGTLLACDPYLQFTIDFPSFTPSSTPVPLSPLTSHLVGSYNLTNMLAAATVGLHFGVSPEDICQALSEYVPSNNRSQLTQTEHNRLIIDAYNANPTSMMAALQNFALITVLEPKMCILGDMGELGDVSHAEHQKVVDYLVEQGLTDVWLIGKEFAGTQCPFRKFPDADAVKEALHAEQPQGKLILVKGSHSTRTYELPPLL